MSIGFSLGNYFPNSFYMNSDTQKLMNITMVQRNNNTI